MEPDEALKTAQRLHDLGIIVRSNELRDRALEHQAFVKRTGNRKMRRAAARRARRARAKA